MMSTNEQKVWDALANTSINTFELPPQIQRMTDRSMENIKVYPSTILKVPAGEESYVNINDPANFKNPTQNTINDYIQVCEDILLIPDLLSVPALYPIANACNTGITQAGVFLVHTNRISGVTKIGTEESDQYDPWLLPAAEVGRTMEYLNYVSTGEKNNTAFQNVFSSVFQSTIDTLDTYIANTANLPSIISGSIVVGEGGGTTSLTAQQISDYTNNITIIYSTMDTRRLEDKQIYQDYMSNETGNGRSTIYGVVSNSFNQIFSTITSNLTF